MTRGFTGRHMAASIVSFFAVVIAVNVYMATEASRTFGGTVVDNSYVASQHFNRWLAEADQQKSLGWTTSVDRDGDRAIVTLTNAPLSARIAGLAEHPLGRMPDIVIGFEEVAPGRYRSVQALPAGRWRLKLDVTGAGRTAYFLDEVPA
jgi:nitrogen fixation protein FixH